MPKVPLRLLKSNLFGRRSGAPGNQPEGASPAPDTSSTWLLPPPGPSAALRSFPFSAPRSRCSSLRERPSPPPPVPPFQSSVPPWKARPKGQQRREAPSGAAAGPAPSDAGGRGGAARRAGSVTATSSRFYVAVPDGIHIDTLCPRLYLRCTFLSNHRVKLLKFCTRAGYIICKFAG